MGHAEVRLRLTTAGEWTAEEEDEHLDSLSSSRVVHVPDVDAATSLIPPFCNAPSAAADVLAVSVCKRKAA